MTNRKPEYSITAYPQYSQIEATIKTRHPNGATVWRDWKLKTIGMDGVE